MATHNDLLEALTKVNNLIDRSKIKTGTLGKFLESTGNRIYDVAGRNGYIWVTLDTGQVISAINSGIGAMAKLQLPVQVIDTPTGPKIWGMDHTKADNNLGPNAPDFGTGPHSHGFGTGLEYMVNALEYEPLLTFHRKQDPALTLYVAPIFYNNLGVDMYYPGGGIDVGSISGLPTTGQWCWIRTGIDPSTNLPVGVAGASVVQTIPLTPDQINLIPFPYISSAAFKFRFNQADFTNYEFDFIDVRFWIGPGASGSGTPGYHYQLVQNNGVDQAAEAKLNFIPGINTYYSFADTPGSSRTDLTISADSAITTVSGDTTLDDTYGTVLVSGTTNITLPTAVGRNGKKYNIKRIGTGVVTIKTTSSQTIDGNLTIAIGFQWTNIPVKSDGANWYIL